MKANKKRWYHRPVGVIILLIFFFPIGLYLMWRYTNWSKKVKSIITGFFCLLCIHSMLSPPDTSITSIELSIPDYQTEYDINAEIPVNISVLPAEADINSLEYIVDDSSLTFSESGIVTGSAGGTYEVRVKSGDIESNTLSISVVDISAREAAQEEEQRLAEERAAQEAEEKRLAEEKTAKEAEEQRLAEEKAAKEAEEQRLAEEKAAKEAEEQRLAEEKVAQASDTSSITSSEQPAATAPSSDMVWIDDSAKRYHRKNGCGMDNAYQVTLEEAIARGKTPCGRCY